MKLVKEQKRETAIGADEMFFQHRELLENR
jgi:hypothetical protein